jgi:RNA polymerase sigma-70 factor (ECF subfamily)
MNNICQTKKQFWLLVEPWSHRLFNIAWHHCGDKSLAQDWSQEALLRAWKCFEQLEDSTLVYAWLLKILNRVIVDDQRRNIRRKNISPVISVDDDYFNAHACFAPGPFAQLMQDQSDSELKIAILQLPEEFRSVILLRDIEGMSYINIANILDIAKGTVMSRLSRGRRLLSSYMLKQNVDTKNMDTTEVENYDRK